MRDPAIFQLSHRLVTALRRSPYTLTEIGYPHGFTQARLSAFCAGRRFGSRVRDRIVLIGASLGLPADACTRRAR